MYELVKGGLLALMKVPPEPHDPMGATGSLRVFRAAKAFLRYRYVGWAIKQLILLASAGSMVGGAIAASWNDADPERALLVVVGILAGLAYLAQLMVTFFAVRLDYEMRWYKITDRSLRIRAGIWGVREHTVTFANIQNISVKQGPLEQMFGIANVHVETAGGGVRLPQQQHSQQNVFNMHEAVFRGVDNAEEIRDIMMERLRKLRDAGLGGEESAARRTAAATAVPGPGASAGAAGPGGWSEASVALLRVFQQEAAALRQAVEVAAQRRA